jgi:hypothetical protein
MKPIPIPVFSYILSARTTLRKHSRSIVVWRRPHRKHVSRIRPRVDLSASSTGRGADNLENTASSIVACWIVFTELLPGNALIKSVTVQTYLHASTGIRNHDPRVCAGEDISRYNCMATVISISCFQSSFWHSATHEIPPFMEFGFSLPCQQDPAAVPFRQTN